MLQWLHRYLIQHKSVSLPGLGTIQLQHIPAIINFTDHLIEPPSLKALLDETRDTPTKGLLQYLAEKLAIEEWEAVKRLNDFSFDLKNDLKQGREWLWQDIGTLKYDPEAGLLLEAVTVRNRYMYPLPAERIIRTDANHTILRGDTEVSESFFPTTPDVGEKTRRSGRQLIWAFILLLLAIGLVFFYLHQTGYDIYGIFNQQ